jgi:RNA binding exosome subunit
MPISLDPAAHYTTQASVYERLAVGVGRRLTNRKIAEYQRRGYYGNSGILALAKQQTAKKKRKQTKRNSLKELLADFDA